MHVLVCCVWIAGTQAGAFCRNEQFWPRFWFSSLNSQT